MAEFAVEALTAAEAAQWRQPWQALAARCLEPSVFAEPAFVLPALRHLARGAGPVCLAVFRRSAGMSELVGLCPAAWSRWPGLASARVWTHQQATAAFPLLDERYAEPALAALLAGVGRLRGSPAALLLTGLPHTGATATMMAGMGLTVGAIEQRTRAVLLRDGAPAGLASKGRKELRRQGKKLGESGPVAYRSATDPEAVAKALSGFLALEAEGWKGRRGTALGSRPATRAFAESVLTDLAVAGQCRIDSLHSGDEAIAMGIVLRSGPTAFFWKTAYDERFARFSPGLQLTARITEQQVKDETIALTDSCAVPGHSMIDRIWPDRMIVADVMVAIRAGEAARFDRVCSIERQKRRLREAAKRWLRRS